MPQRAAARDSVRFLPGCGGRMVDEYTNPGIAVVGMAVRTPGAADLEAFWQMLLEGRDCISHFTVGELDSLVPGALREHPHFVAARGVLEEAERSEEHTSELQSRGH